MLLLCCYLDTEYWSQYGLINLIFAHNSLESTYLIQFNSIPLFSAWRNTICNLAAYDVAHW
jgi:hypothetical protein